MKSHGRRRGRRKKEQSIFISVFFDLALPPPKMTSYQAPEVSGPSPVLLHVYDVTNASSNAVNTAVAGLNRLTKDILGLGGVFHGGDFFVFFTPSTWTTSKKNSKN